MLFIATGMCRYESADGKWRIEIVGHSSKRSLCVVYRSQKFSASIEVEHADALGAAIQHCHDMNRSMEGIAPSGAIRGRVEHRAR